MATDKDLSEHEQAIVRALHQAATTERAPARLRERLERQRLEGRRGKSAWGLPALGSRAWAGVAATVLAVVVAAALLIPGGTPGAPSISAAAALASKGSTLTAPGPDPIAPYLLSARVENLHFPNWEEQRAGWVAVGARTDRLGNRDVTTVFYKRGDQKIAYSIVSSPELASTGVMAFMHNGRTVFVWRESGHTCLLSGVGVPASTLRDLVIRTSTHTT